MARRTLMMWLAAVGATLLTLGAAVVRVPYVALGPGPVFDTLGRVNNVPVLSITGRPTHPTDGHLFATTVNVLDQLTLAQALAAWLSRSSAVVPRELVYPPGQSDRQARQQQVQDMRVSQDAATVAALTELHLYQPEVAVVQVQPGVPAAGILKPGDVITGVDGKPVPKPEVLRRLIGAHRVGTKVRVTFTRGGHARTVSIPTVRSTDPGPARPVIGVLTEERNVFPVRVAISLKDVGGPSAGLMFALGIVDKLGGTDLTGGRTIAGTGEISADGSVSRIGGIGQKERGARANHATVFLVPSDNCAEAAANRPKGMQLIRVRTLHDAVSQLQVLRAGGSATPC